MNSVQESDRLPLISPEALTPAQRPVYERLVTQIGPWARGLGFEAVSTEGLLLGPFNALLYTPEITATNLEYFDAERKLTSLTPAVREAVIVSVALHFGAKYEEYVHTHVASSMGVDIEKIRVAMLSETGPTQTFATLSDESLCVEVVKYTLREHRLPLELYQSAVEAFGYRGIVEIAHLVGMYAMVSFVLNAFEIPVPTEAL